MGGRNLEMLAEPERYQLDQVEEFHAYCDPVRIAKLDYDELVDRSGVIGGP